MKGTHKSQLALKIYVNELANHYFATVKSFELFVIIFGVCFGSLLFFHQAPQVEKESGAEGEDDIGNS